MSASKNKLQRKQQIEAGTDKKTNAAAKEQAQRRKTTITYSIVAVVLVIFFAFIFIFNSALPSRHITAVSINGEDYSVAELNYYYATSYMNFYSTYSSLIPYGVFFDPNQSLADQEYSEGTSWRDYFLETAVDNMTQIQMLNDQAEAAGFTLPEDQQAAYDAEIESLETSWSGLGYSNLKQYINLNYGKGVDEDMIKEQLYRTYVASAYSQSLTDGYEYSADELNTYYSEHADELDIIDYAYYSVTVPAPAETEDAAEDTAEDTETEDTAEDAETEDEAEETTEDTETEAEDTVDTDAMVEAIDGTDEETFTEYLAENVDGASPIVNSSAGSELSETYSEWLLDDAREPGDATAISADGVTYVVMFLDRSANDYPTVNFRHILIQAEDADGDGVSTEDEIKAADDEAQSLYDQWQAGDATEDSFAELANANSDDAGSNTTGGLYENVYKGQMVDPINEWLFDDARKAGDTTVVSYEGSYTGTHVLYYAGESDLTYAQYQADTALRNDAYSTWQEEQLANYEAVTSHLGLAAKIH